MPIPGIVASGISGHLTAPSSFYSIATVTAAGGETSLTFSSIPGTYKSLQIRGIVKDTNTTDYSALAAQFYILPNNDTTTTYSDHSLYGNTSTANAYGQTSGNGFMMYGSYISSNATFANIYGVVIIDIQDYASTTKYKTSRAFVGADANGSGTTNRNVALNSGLYQTTTAITSLVIKPAATAFAAGSTFALYGIN